MRHHVRRSINEWLDHRGKERQVEAGQVQSTPMMGVACVGNILIKHVRERA